MKRKHKLFKKWDYIVLFIIALTGIIYYYVIKKRAEAGYFQSGQWIFWSDFLNIIFFGLVTGYLIAKIVQKTRR